MIRRPVALALSLLLLACGSGDSRISEALDAGVACDEGERRCGSGEVVEVCSDGEWTLGEACGDGMRCNDAAACEPCPRIDFTVQTTQSCTVGLTPGTEVDAEASVSLQGQDFRIMALDRWGEGHVMAWCDSSSFADLLLEWNAF